MGKRANGEGTVTKRKDGRWESRLSYLDPETGQRKRQAFYGRTAREVRDKLKGARDRIDDGRPPRDATTTVAAWLAHWRATTLAASVA
jgi:integrase